VSRRSDNEASNVLKKNFFLRPTIPANLRGLRKLAEQRFYHEVHEGHEVGNIFFTLILFLRDLRALRGELFFSELCVSAPLRLGSGHALREIFRVWLRLRRAGLFVRSFESWLLGVEGRFPESVTPECFNRGASSGFSGFPLKACGNDGLLES
jgi:hypothetical protein